MNEKRRSPGRRACLAALAAAVVFVGPGCSGGGRASSRATLDVAQQASYDHLFYSEPGEFAKLSEAERRALIEAEIGRLAGPAWQEARSRLFTMGREAIELLIKNLDRTEPTEAELRSLPGRAVKDQADTWTLGQVVYAVLCEFVGCHTNYASALPGFDKAEWTAWWAKNKDLTIYSDLTRAPPYVHSQMEAARKAMSARYEPTKIEEKKLAKASASQKRTERSAVKKAEPAPEKAVRTKAPAAKPEESRKAPGLEKAASEKAKPAEPEPQRGGRKKSSGSAAPAAARATAPAPAAPEPAPPATPEPASSEETE